LLVDRLLAEWSRLEQLDKAVNALSDQLDAFQRRLEQQDERLRSLEAAQHRAAFQEQFA
jgi:prefoldin subunit 5